MKNMVPLTTPYGLTEIVSTFGNVFEYIKKNPGGDLVLVPEFENKYIATAHLPFPILLARSRNILVSDVRCHRLLSGRIEKAFKMILDQGLRDDMHTFGGCFHFRPKRNGAGLSAHSWGIALDLDCETNQPGTSGTMSTKIIAIFKNLGFVWGGDWENDRDPMHFQYCSGY